MAATLQFPEFVQAIVSAVIALAGFLTAIVVIVKYSKTVRLWIEDFKHSGCPNHSTMRIILGNSIVHRCEQAREIGCLPQEQRNWLVKLMEEYETNRHWNGVVKDQYEQAMKLPPEIDN